jgi:antirestriction protein ArdC
MTASNPTRPAGAGLYKSRLRFGAKGKIMQDLYQAVTNKIIAQIEAGTLPWEKPWADSATSFEWASNAVSGKEYRGINQWLLDAKNYPSNKWLTFKQARDLGGNVRKGEKGEMIVFFKPWKVADVNAASGDVVERTIPLLRSFHVFNVAQCDNLPESIATTKRIDSLQDHERIAKADAMMARAEVIHGGDKAYYRMSADTITLPARDQFKSIEAYYSVALHELTHWTGHKTRLDREYGKRFGDTAYAREELVAEMGAAYLCAAAGMQYQTQHAAYVNAWLSVLENDKRAIIMAASAAQKAADFVLGAQASQDEAEPNEAAA